MAYKFLKMPSMSRVTPGSKAVLELPVGPTYKKITFFVTAASGLDVTDIGRIDLVINSQVVQTFKNLARLNAVNAYWNREADTMAATAAEFSIHLERGEFDGLAYQRMPGVGTADVQTLQVEVDIAAAAPATIAIVAFAEIDTIPAPLGVFFKVREYPLNSSVSGKVEMDKLPKGPWYSAIHLFKEDVNAVELLANSVRVVDATKAALERAQKGSRPVRRVPQTAAATHIDFVLDGDMANSLRSQALEDLRVIVDLGTSGAVDVVTETLDQLAGA